MRIPQKYSLLVYIAGALLFFTMFGVISELEDFVGDSRRQGNVWNGLWRSLWGWNSWVPTVPVAYWVVKKHLDENSKVWQAVLYILLGTGLVVLYKGFFLEYLSPMFFPRPWGGEPSLQNIFHFMISRKVMIESLIFWFILGTMYALRYSQLLKERDIEQSQMQSELANAQLSALKMQLQPHFLFNTLNSISTLLREKTDPHNLQANMETADEMITNLSEMFRHTLQTADVQLISLREELAFLENYLEIELVRFSDRLTIEKEIDSGLGTIEVPAFILQPLVENAIRHGNLQHAGPGMVRIRICKRDDRLEMRVIDNGPCTEDDLQGAFEKGVGLQNTLKRLEHLYGDEFDMQLSKNENQETEAVIVIPIKTSGQFNKNRQEET